MACDLCGKNDSGLNSLNQEYQTKDIKQICGPCGSKVNDHMWKIRSINTNFLQAGLKRWMEERKAK